MTALARADDHWMLPVMGQSVTQLCPDYAVTLRLANELAIRIEQPFVITTRSEERLIVPEADADQLTPVLKLVRTTVTEGAAFDDGHLEFPSPMEFASRSHPPRITSRGRS